jgi:hypothetical protein
LVNQELPESSSNNSSIIGIGNLIGTVMELSARKSMHRRQVPSFFHTRITREENGSWLGWITPFARKYFLASNLVWVVSWHENLYLQRS